MTTDPFPKEAARARGRILDRRHGQGLGHDRADDGDHARLRHDRCRGRAGCCSTRALREAVNDTFNAITVDGECSTNDSVMLLANGASGVRIDEDNYGAFVAALRAVCLELALGIVRGGEGATKLVTVTVTGAASPEEARRAAKAIANSLLVKTAIHGGDPNWGRLIAVAGRAGVAFELPARGASRSGRRCCSRTARRTTSRRRRRRST